MAIFFPSSMLLMHFKTSLNEGMKRKPMDQWNNLTKWNNEIESMGL